MVQQQKICDNIFQSSSFSSLTREETQGLAKAAVGSSLYLKTFKSLCWLFWLTESCSHSVLKVFWEEINAHTLQRATAGKWLWRSKSMVDTALRSCSRWYSCREASFHLMIGLGLLGIDSGVIVKTSEW